VDQQATRKPPFQSRATIYPGRLKGSQGVTPFLKVTGEGLLVTWKTLKDGLVMLVDSELLIADAQV
jgi:hypothetical protein